MKTPSLPITLFCVCSCAGLSALHGQSTFTGNVSTDAAQPLAFANVVLLAALDSGFVAGAITEASGDFRISADVPDGAYLLRISSIGYADGYSPGFSVSGPNQGAVRDMGTFALVDAGVQLTTATVTAAQPLMERRLDRTIINVANQPTAVGQTALQVLERSPGIFVDRNSGSISMLGKSGVRVMINGRLNYMPADGLVAYLAGIPASNIIRLELITTPSAELDAEGNAGYIDIVLKRLPDEGLRGNYSVMGGFGGNRKPNREWRYGEQASATLGATYRKGRVSAFGDVSYQRDGSPQSSTLLSAGPSAQGIQLMDFSWDRNSVRDAVNARAGVDIQLAEGTTLGILASGYLNRFSLFATQRNRFSTGGRPDTLMRASLREVNFWRHAQGGVSLSQNLAGAATLRAGLDYLAYGNTNPVDYDLNFGDVSEQVFYHNTVLASRKDSPFGIWVGTLDYKRPLGTGTLSLGGKAVLSDFTNTVSLDRQRVRDREYSSVSMLNERVGAAYAQYAGSVPAGGEAHPLEYQLGLRYEHTDTQLDEAGEAAPVVDRNYGLLFPSVSLGYTLSEQLKVTAGYSRRIQRPSFSEMASFVIFLTPTTSFGGNPALQPALANAVELGIQRRGTNLTLSYTNIDSAIAPFQVNYDQVTGAQVVRPFNLRNQQVAAASLGLPTNLAPWWHGQLNFTASYIKAASVLDVGLVTLEQFNVQVAGGQSFTLRESLSLNLGGFFSSPTITGSNRRLAMGVLNVALQKKLATGSLTLGVDDVFDTLRFRGSTELAQIGYRSDFTFDFSGPTAKLTWSSTFGNSRVNELRKDSAAEERGRVN